ncbi:cob(I)yrinic acid a,c-diamide adenosyltransferase [Wenyingzhuangia aestuarii]|uniref:cob(I)yrinic acid a,c-diamide adenosyltransferase n=1 Tax=Wenyingzhuangia aestuarii TaxID=1647582 RepID=UPI00143A3F23|nr:cob(I)yrinic acid a,c-diamide adenosyltransferase [Wenyingzhuangia aestuarii]NJB83331.1 cob(I)alamin adenosyltransferase [Wenyingzhuangia aestuarii]
MKIYTKTGDKGETSLFGGKRVSKSHIRIDAYGTVDELNSYLGLIRDQDINQQHKDFIIKIQNELFVIGAFLATPQESETLKNGKSRLGFAAFGDQEIQELEKQIDLLDNTLPQMTHFVLPGGHISVSHCHVARTICRRAERISVLLNEHEPVNTAVISYLNRLSDYLFVLARMLSNQLQADEIKWIPNK